MMIQKVIPFRSKQNYQLGLIYLICISNVFEKLILDNDLSPKQIRKIFKLAYSQFNMSIKLLKMFNFKILFAIGRLLDAG